MFASAKVNTNPSSKYDVYFIHYNGGNTFRAAIDEEKMHAIIYLNEYDENYENYDSKSRYKVILDTKFEKVFLGGPVPEDLMNNNNYEFELGNSILLHITGSTYIFIGMYIYEFESESPILEYISRIGNNDVPYPFAKSATETFLMIEDAVIDNELLEEEGRKYPVNANNPYRLYYKFGAQFIFTNEYLPKKRNMNRKIIHDCV